MKSAKNFRFLIGKIRVLIFRLLVVCVWFAYSLHIV